MSILEKRLSLIGLIFLFGASTLSMFARELYFGSILTAVLVFCFTKVLIDLEGVEDEN